VPLDKSNARGIERGTAARLRDGGRCGARLVAPGFAALRRDRGELAAAASRANPQWRPRTQARRCVFAAISGMLTDISDQVRDLQIDSRRAEPQARRQDRGESAAVESRANPQGHPQRGIERGSCRAWRRSTPLAKSNAQGIERGIPS